MSYPTTTYPAGKPTGYEYSPAPTQGGSVITVNEASIVAASDPVTLGQPCHAGGITGVCVRAGGSNQDCLIQTTGIFSVPVVASDAEGTENVTVGALLYIHATTGVVSLVATGKPFGYALSALTGAATASNIPVKLATV